MAIVTVLGEVKAKTPSNMVVYLPMLEIAGTQFLDVVTGALLNCPNVTVPTFAVDDAVTFSTSNWDANNGKWPEEIENTLVAFGSYDTREFGVDLAGNAKLGFSHFRTSTVIFDIQVNSSDGVAQIKVAPKNLLGGGTTTIITLPAGFLDNKSVSIACIGTIGSADFAIHIYDGTTVTIFSDTADFVFTSFATNALNQADSFGPKNCDCFAWGAYIEESIPTDAKIAEFLEYIFTQPRASNKVPYIF